MTRYYDRDRRDWRARLHAFRRRLNALLCALLLLAVLLAPSVAQAGTVRCRWPWQPVKVRMADGSYGWTCFYVWEGR